MTGKNKVRSNRLSWIVVVLLLAGLLIACIALGLHILNPGSKEKTNLVDEDTLQVICPKLSECADAFLLKYKDQAILIDTSVKADGRNILQLLKENGVESLNAMILTHYDKDHIGGAAEILRNIPVKKCFVTLSSEDSEEYAALMDAFEEVDTEQVVITDVYSFRGIGGEITIYPPRDDVFKENVDNNMSLITKISFKGRHLLFAGDAQKERMKQFVKYQYDGTQYDFLKVSHHGKDHNPTEQLLKKFVPSFALISSSEEEPEEAELVDVLKNHSVNLWYTKDGDLTFYVKPDRIQVEQNGEVFEKKYDSGKYEEENTEKKTASSDEVAEVSQPVFSKDSGFYEEAFDLSIDAPEGTTVYYTIGSGTPTASSTQYSEPIPITDPSSNPIQYANNPDFWPYITLPAVEGAAEVVPGYYSRYDKVRENLDQCMIVRAVAVDAQGNCSKVKTATYFIGYHAKSGYENIAVMSLVSDPENLFSDDRGIMVNGGHYKEMLSSGKLDGILDTHTLRDYTNSYNGRGREWERPVHVDFYGENGKELLFSQEIGMRLHGNQSRVATFQKSFNLYARKDYDGNKTFLKPFFEDGLLQDTVTLMSGIALRNYYLIEKLNHRSMDTQNYRMVQLFLDGEYWGMYAIQDRYNSKRYMKDHYALAKEDYNLEAGKPLGYVLKNGPEKTTTTSLKLLKDYLASHDLSDPKEYRKVCAVMDMQSFIDNYAARMYTSDQDWSWFKNVFILFYDNKWHWLAYDIDYGAGAHDNARYDTNTFESNRLYAPQNLRTDPFFPHLIKSEQFRIDFANTFLDLSNGVYASPYIKQDKEAFFSKYKDAIAKEEARYPAIVQEAYKPLVSFQKQWDSMEEFFVKRPQYGIQYMKDFMGFQGELTLLYVKLKDQQGGKVKINTLTLPFENGDTWGGYYLTDCPVTVTAIPEEGWTFDGWECENGNIASTEKTTTTVKIAPGTVITARYVKNTK